MYGPRNLISEGTVNRLKLTLLASAFALGGSAAMAADLPVPEVPMIAAAPIVWSWTGPYAGLFIGGGFNGDIDGHHGSKSVDDLSGVFGGGYVGYNWQMDSFLLGLETDAGFTGWDTDQGKGKHKGWKGEVGHDDLAAPAAKIERADERADRRRYRGHHRDLGGPGVDQPREGCAHAFAALDPQFPGRALGIPVGQVGVVGRADLV